MKKSLSWVLITSLFFSISATTFAQPTTVLSEEFQSMQSLGLIQSEDEDEGLTNLYVRQNATKKQLQTILLRLSLPQSDRLSAILDSLDSKAPLHVEEFYSIFLECLGYELNVDFTDSTVISFARSIGLSPNTSSTFTNDELAKALNDCLKSKTKSGREFFEVLIENGFLASYNDDKTVPEILVFDGKTQPIFNHDEAIYEMVYVESPQDTDLDGKRDLIEVWIKRPKETEEGMKVPAIFEMSPYLQGTNDDLYILHNVDEDLTIGEATSTTLEDVTYVPEERVVPEARQVKGTAENAKVEPFEFGDWYNYFFARGYAVVFSGGIGTYNSEGLNSTGSEEETISTVAVIDWLNGRTKAFTNKTDNIEVTADWCTGNVGMSGRSYRGTLPIAAAATGVEGLKTIVPVAAISNWYDYYRANGLNLAGETWQGDDTDLLAIYCMSRMLDEADYAGIKDLFEASMEEMQLNQDRVSGDYNVFWDERNYLNNVDKMTASVFIVHGLSDWNVKPKQFDKLWEKLQENNIPSKMVVHQGEHMSIGNLNGIDFNDMMNRWFDYWLYDIDNNVMETIPTATIQNNVSMEFEGFDSWPVTSKSVKFSLDGTNHSLNFNNISTDTVETFTDDLSLSGYDRDKQNGNDWLDALVRTPEESRLDRLAYISDSLTNDLHISGTTKMSITASLDQPTGILSAMLVDYGTEYRATIDTEVVVPNGIIYGGNAGSDDIIDFIISDTPSDYKVITRGWMDAQNRVANYRVDPITPGTEYTFTFEMEPMNYTLKAGHKLGLIIYSTDAQFSMRPLTITNFNVNTAQTTVEIPIVNGRSTW